MATGGNVCVQTGRARANLLEQMPADDLSRLLISFQGVYQSCVNKLALLGARLHRLELLARPFVGTQVIEQSLFLGRRHEVWMPMRWGGYDRRCAQDCE